VTTTLVDGDLVAYRCAASAEKDEEFVAFARANKTLQDIVSATGCDSIDVFLSGSTNFRYAIYPEYKANRRDMVRPRHLETVREFLVTKWGAKVTDGYEADDAIGIHMVGETICCSLDKDLKQLPGNHYNFVTGLWDTVSELDGWRNFYTQLVLGDRADNVPGYDGKMRPKFPKFLAAVRDELACASELSGMHDCVDRLYQDKEALIRNARLLYVWRKENDSWQPHQTKAEATSVEKHAEEVKSVSMRMMVGEIIPSTGRGGTKPKKGGYRRRGQSTGSVRRKTSRANSTST
jgi:DNA polymerase-1